ncbi:hypothetical protein PHYPSEUDO_009505 [Phytophthora pseudosyringae]|uniref:Restriction endonuclease domain-containing protein n=1 Tax=Phytophthora pseudosyringae TaxID=221518 RepID=A0A8T1VF49_9STRA|nr:hypothetical protein PHYPSEUDO_009505 [Phytophthora pseudosyringae]
MPVQPQPTMRAPESLLDRVNRELREREDARKALGDDAELQPVVVWERTTLKDFEEWLMQHEGELGRWNYEPTTEDTGRLVIAGGGHDLSLMDTVISQGNRTLTFNEDALVPDGAPKPRDAAPGEFPTLILEVAYSEECQHLLGKLQTYVENAAIQVAIGVQIPYFVSPTHSVFLYQRDGRGNVCGKSVEFGQGLPRSTRLLSFSLRKLFFGVGMPRELAGLENYRVRIDNEWLDTLDYLIRRYKPER